jgi:hypothetical protein
MSNSIETNVYNTDRSSRHETRGLAKIDNFWNVLGVGRVDDQFSSQIEGALSQDRQEINFLDLGSGDNAALIRQIINDKGDKDTSFLKKTREILESHPDFRIRIVGLTDAKSPDDFLKREPIKPVVSFTPPHPTDGQILAENVSYTLSQEQSLERFLDEVGMKDLDIVSATMIFPYLDFGLFSRDVKAIIDALRSNGGTFIASGFINGEKATREVDDEIRNNYGEEFLLSEAGHIMRKQILMRKVLANEDMGEKNAREAVVREAAANSDREVDVNFQEVSFTVVKH